MITLMSNGFIVRKNLIKHLYSSQNWVSIEHIWDLQQVLFYFILLKHI